MSNYPDDAPSNFDSASEAETFADTFADQEIKPYFDQKAKCKLEIYSAIKNNKLLPAYTRAFDVFDKEYKEKHFEVDEYCDDFKTEIESEDVANEELILAKIEDFLGMLELESILLRPCRDEEYQIGLEYFHHNRKSFV